ncbi:hypothetical protein B1757_07260 [Acidithiobacillus marinus]|uniref:Uncharacterized protein n=1 Tax=Acidithiobacillus marinus TaxID=187490 RepID=A0A2I1DM06_9PROT|nr:DUF3311 domain-containing protein [Acidithiobacillus marinus]PKY10909.1 hypothetical protein B1757_07260 [Acidithiobacillus marinus]
MSVAKADHSPQEPLIERITGFLEGEKAPAKSSFSLPGIILSAGEGSIRHYQFHPDEQDVPVTPLVCQSQDPLPEHIKTELLVRQGHIVAIMLTSAQITLQPEILRRAAIREVLQREWLLSVFLFGPVLGVVLVNMIFGMPVFLWWTALGVLVFSCLIMGILIRNDLRKLQSWVQGLHTLARQQQDILS